MEWLSPEEATAPTGADHFAPSEIGASVGRYVVLEEIGRGGMGRVLRAYDPKLQREVALKEVRRDALGTTGALRSIAEARAMAKLSHPNVVAVYDVEEIEHDQVVLVMEYVAGQTLTARLHELEVQRGRRAWQDIVPAFLQAGRGLAAAHAAGVLHRDFKPDNVLVGTDGRVRVTDFGLAVLVGLGDPGSIVGTVPYLAPERLFGAPADATSDQFAYCVSLWQALFGERPFVGHSVGELAFAMAAGPPRPPASASRLPKWLLDAVTRGLASDPGARWPDMQALLHALSIDPAARRRQVRWAALGIGVLGLAATAVQTWASARAQRCSPTAAAAHLQGAWDDARRAEVHDAVLGIGTTYANEVWRRTEHTLDAYASAWTQMHVETCEATTVRGEQSTAVMDLRMACLHRARVDLGAVTQVLAEADAETVSRAHEVIASLRPLERCADVEALQADVEPPMPDEADAVESIRVHLARARASLDAGQHDDARAALDAATTRVADVRYGPVQAEVANTRGAIREGEGDYAGAEQASREALRLASRWRQPEEMQDAATRLLLVVGARLQRFDEALRYADLAQGLAEPDAQREARASAALASVLYERGEYADAEAKYRTALALREGVLAADHVDVLESKSDLAAVLHAQGLYEQAEVENRDVLALRESTLGPEHPAVAKSRHNLALVLHAQGKLEEAEAEHRHALALREQAMGPDHPEVAASRRDLAAVLQTQGKLEEAEAEHRRALAVSVSALGPNHGDVAASLNDLAICLAVQGKLDEAEIEFRRALAVEEKVLGADHHAVAQSHHNLANVLEEQGDLGDAEVEHRRALAVLEAALGSDHPKLAASRTSLARLLLERGELEESLRLAEAAWSRRQRDDTPAPQRAHTAFVLAQARWANGDRKGGIALAERALTDYDDPHDAEIVRTWLAEHRR